MDGRGRMELRRVDAAAKVVLTGVIIAAAMLVAAAPRATASKGWCRTDPVVMIAGEVVDIFVSAPFDAPLHVTGPTEVVVTVPVGVDAQLVATDLGFGQGVEVTFAESARLKATANRIEVKTAVLVPATDSAMPVRVEFAPRVVGLLAPAEAEGTANSWVALRTSL